jgi:hypothetical protein
MESKLNQSIASLMCDGKKRSLYGIVTQIAEFAGDMPKTTDVYHALDSGKVLGWVVEKSENDRGLTVFRFVPNLAENDD